MHKRFLAAIVIAGVACSAAFSSDGEKDDAGRSGLKGSVVFAGERDGQWDIWIMKASGNDVRRLTNDAHKDSDPVFSPDGKTIMFSSLREGFPRIFMMDRDGGNVREICEGCQSSFATDGKSIVFIRDNQAYRRELESGQERLISPEMWERCGFPHIHPDGKKFVLSSRHREAIGIYLVSLEDAAAPTVDLATGKEACSPRFSPDGRWILYQTSSNVCRIGTDNKGNEQLTYGGDVQHYAAWSPDGKAIVFCRAAKADGPWKIYVMDIESEKEFQLTDKGSSIFPSWHKD